MLRMRLLYCCMFMTCVTGLISCGPSKELLASHAKADSLTNVIYHKNDQISDLHKQVSQQEMLTSQLKTADSLQLINIKRANRVAMQEAADCKMAKEAAARRMEELNQAMTANGTPMKEIRKKAEDALIAFTNAGVEVTYKNGLVYISMQDELLFTGGSAKLAKNGQEALAVVAKVLNDNPNLLIYVIGNTDSIKVTRGFTDNWSLSTERANSVVRILRDQYLVSMNRVTAAGRGKYAPIADNATPEGRARNRRTDIILNPDLSRLWDLIDKQQ